MTRSVTDDTAMLRRWLFVPPVVQFGTVAVWSLGWPPATTVGLSAQFVAVGVALVVYGALAIARLRALHRTHKDIQRRRRQQTRAFQEFVDEHTASVPRT